MPSPPNKDDAQKTAPPSLLGRSLAFARRLTIFYLFVFVSGLCFGVYYYKYLPGNEQSLNARGFRILNRLSANIAVKYNDFVGAVDNIVFADSLCQYNDPVKRNTRQQENIRQLSRNINFTYDFNHNARFPAGSDSFYYEGNFMYWHSKSTPALLIGLKGLLDPLFEKRNDFFDDYVLLSKNANPSEAAVIYDQLGVTQPGPVNIDSALGLRKNSDITTISDIRIAGRAYKLYLRPFSINNHRLILGGLLEKTNYDRKMRTLPPSFLSSMLIFILLALIALPFIKIYMLSPKEGVSNKDAVSLSLSIFVGSGIVFLIIFYWCIGYTQQLKFDMQLSRLGDSITRDIDKELSLASRQLDDYSRIYDSLHAKKRDSLLMVLSYATARKADSVDQIFTPRIFKNIDRVFWINDTGATLAKWNPFNFNAALSGVRDLTFFKRLQEGPGPDSLAVYPGFSNVTNEFQVIIAKPNRDSIWTRVNCETVREKSTAISLAVFLSCSNYPVLPPGYGFCLVDNRSGEVLVHSDYRHSLSENLFEETNNNSRLSDCIRYKNSDPIDDATLYGKPTVLRVLPISSQPLSLVAYYDKDIVYENLLRLVHFAAEGLLYLYIFLTIGVLLSTYRRSKPSKLRFKLSPADWIRPSHKNVQAYTFTNWFFGFITGLIVVLFAIVTLFNLDIRALLYVVILAPFYGLWGIVSSRRRNGAPAYAEASAGKQPRFYFLQLITQNRITFVCILVVNWGLLELMLAKDFHHGAEVFVIFFVFQVLSLLFLWLYHTRFWKTFTRTNVKFSYAYLASLYLSMVLVGILPVTMLVTYGFQAEKIQFAKKKNLATARAMEQRTYDISHKLLPGYKPLVLAAFSAPSKKALPYIDSVKYEKGIYLPTADKLSHHTIKPVLPAGDCLPDEPYSTLMDNLFLLTSAGYNQYSIKNKGADTSWQFSCSQSPANSLGLVYQNQLPGTGPAFSQVQSSFTNSWESLFRLPGHLKWMLFICIPLFLFGIGWLLRSCMNRLFLLDYFSGSGWICIDNAWLDSFFQSFQPDNTCAYRIDLIAWPAYCKAEWQGQFESAEEKEEYILVMTHLYGPVYDKLYNSLSEEEQYFLYDFAKDGYTNYKDTDTLVCLLNKGVLLYTDNRLRLFNQSFRNYLLAKKGTEEMAALKNKYAVPGVWETFRTPALVVIAVSALFLLFTQDDFSHRFGALVTSITAFVPLISKLAEKIGVMKST